MTHARPRPPQRLIQTARKRAKPNTEGADVFEQIRKLGELRDAGFLTADEFDAKKTDLLSRL